MANDTQLTVVGNLTADPELRYTQNGLPVVNFTIASTPRTFDRQANEWKDGEALFLRCSAWREFAEHIAASLSKGNRVIAQGNLKMRSYEDKEGASRTSTELEIQAIGPELTWATAVVTRAASQNSNQQGQQTPQGYGQPQQGQAGWPPAGNYGTVPSYAGGSPTPQPQQGGWPSQPQPGAWGAAPQGGAQYGSDEPF